MRRVVTTVRRACTTAGIAGITAGCAGMAAMLPGAVAGALGAIGIGGSSALARTLSPVTQPLYIGSAILVIVGALTCSRLVSVFAIGGSLLLYLSMFELVSAGTSGAAMSMSALQQPHRATRVHAEPVAFYVGLAFLLAAFALTLWRRRRRSCRPLLRLPLSLRGIASP